MKALMVDIQRVAANCELRADGIWYARSGEAISYPADGHDACAQLEDSSFWFKHRNACIAAAVQSFPPSAGETIFDIGAGNGYVSLGLSAAGFEVAVVEPGAVGAANAKRRGLRTVVCATTTAAGFAPHSLGAIGLFDVIEHVPDDLDFLQAMQGLLKPGGRLYATVPAYSALWSAEDDNAGHFRRYRLSAIAQRLQQAGFALDYATYIFRPLPLPILLMRALPYRLGLGRRLANRPAKAAEEHMTHQGPLHRALLALLGTEVAHIRAGRRMRFGGSCLLVARRAA